MKNNILLLLSLPAALTLCAQATEHRETIARELRFEQAGADNLLIIRNISGDIAVEGYDGATVQLEVIKTIRAKTGERIDRGRQEVALGVVERSGTILCYLRSPCSEDFAGVSEQSLREGKNWGWRQDCRWDADYDHQLDYRLKVPRSVQLRLSTVNNGDIEVRGVSGRLQLNNVNGAIAMEQVAGPAEARTVNGDLTFNVVNLAQIYRFTGNWTDLGEVACL